MADPPRRVNFFHGLLLTAADLAAEQDTTWKRGTPTIASDGYGTVSGP